MDATTTTYLKGRKLYYAVVALNCANGVAFVDLLGISAILPAVSVHFGPSSPIEWAIVSQLIGSTVGQCVLGYLSDVWSRRTMLLFALSLLLVGVAGSGLSFLSQSAIPFIVARLLSGIAVGSISSLVNISQSDFATRAQRLKLQGVQGVSIALGSILGALVGAAFSVQGNAPRLYGVEGGLTILAILLIACFVPHHRQPPSGREVLRVARTIDYAGILLGTGFLVSGLVVMTKYSKLDRLALGLLAATAAVCCLFFLFVGFKKRSGIRPIVPFELFRNRTLTAIYVQNVLLGAAYYTFIYFLPVYLMIVRQIEPVQAAAMMVPYFACHGICSTVSARVVAWLQGKERKSFSRVILFGFTLWAVVAATIAVTATKLPPIGVTILQSGLVGLGTGSVFQNSVLAIRDQVTQEENAVALGLRNVLRYLGGAIGTAVSGLIMQLTLKKHIPSDLARFGQYTINEDELDGISLEDQSAVQSAFGIGVSYVFYTSALLLAFCVFLSFLIQDKIARKGEDVEKANEQANSGHADTSRCH